MTTLLLGLGLLKSSYSLPELFHGGMAGVHVVVKDPGNRGGRNPGAVCQHPPAPLGGLEHGLNFLLGCHGREDRRKNYFLQRLQICDGVLSLTA